MVELTRPALKTRSTHTAEPAAPTEPGRKRRRKSKVGVRVPAWFVLPALAIYLFIVIVPSLRGAVYAFTDWDGFSSTFSFVGMDNFSKVFSDAMTRTAILDTLLLAVVVVIVQNAIGLALALGLNTRIKSRYVLRVIFFTPVVLTPLVAGYVWSFLLSPQGTVNSVLNSLGLHSLTQDWLGNPKLALWSIMAEIIWQNAGYSMVIFLAGLQAIPEDVMEAATIDGAGMWTRFRRVTLPLLNSAVVINVVLCLIGSLKQFDQVMSMTGGGPGHSSETISTAIYKTAFQLGDYPTSIAMAVVMTILVAGLATAQYKLTSRKVS